PTPPRNRFKHLHLQLILDRDHNHVVIWYLILRHQSGHPPLPPRYSAARAFSFTSFASLTSSKSFTIRTSKTPLPQLLYNPHLRAPLGSAGNKGLITPLESALTKNSPVSLLESALTKRWGVGGTPYPGPHSGLRRSLMDFRPRRTPHSRGSAPVPSGSRC